VPSKDSARRLRDILGNIERIERYTAGMTLEGFVADTKTADAVERCLARISEAVSLPELPRGGSRSRRQRECLR
jgi:uncharacterized protein with HEPN domain